MSEKIIIDNFDVTDCVYLCPPKKLCPAKPMPYGKVSACLANCKEHNTKHNFCKNNPNCYYKQLSKAKEALRFYASQKRGWMTAQQALAEMDVPA